MQNVLYFTTDTSITTYTSLPATNNNLYSVQVCDGFYLQLANFKRYITFALTTDQYITSINKLCQKPICSYQPPVQLLNGYYEASAYFTSSNHQFEISVDQYYSAEAEYIAYLQNAVDCNLQGKFSFGRSVFQPQSFVPYTYSSRRNLLTTTTGTSITYNVAFAYPATGNAAIDARTVQIYYGLLTAQYAANITKGGLSTALNQFCTYANNTGTCLKSTTTLPAFSGPFAGPTTITTPTSGGSSTTTLFDANSLRSIIIAVIVAIIVFIVSLCVYWYCRRRYNKRDFIVESKPSSSSSPLAFDGSLLFPTDDYRDSFVGTPFGGNSPFGGNTYSRNSSTRNLNETPRDSFAASLT